MSETQFPGVENGVIMVLISDLWEINGTTIQNM